MDNLHHHQSYQNAKNMRRSHNFVGRICHTEAKNYKHQHKNLHFIHLMELKVIIPKKARRTETAGLTIPRIYLTSPGFPGARVVLIFH